MPPDCTLIVNSTDSYEDTWKPFFILLKRFWPECPYPIVLNTESKDFALEGLAITVSKVGDPSGGSLDWSERLLRCLRKIETPYVLCMQDDYFISDVVDSALVERIVQIAKSEDWSCVRIMETGGCSGYQPAPVHPELFWKVHPRANYRLHTQAALWKRESLVGYLRSGETIWQFERAGSVRALRIPDSFYCMNRKEFNAKGRFPIPYTPTGIIKGKWYEPAVIPLFEDNGIDIDFSKRGFFRQTGWQKFIRRCRSRLRVVYMWLR